MPGSFYIAISEHFPVLWKHCLSQDSLERRLTINPKAKGELCSASGWLLLRFELSRLVYMIFIINLDYYTVYTDMVIW